MLSRDITGISHFLDYFESGIWDGICKVGYAKRGFSSWPNQFLRWVGGKPWSCGDCSIADAPQRLPATQPAYPCSSLFFHCLYLFSYRRSLRYHIEYPVAIHSVLTLCRPANHPQHTSQGLTLSLAMSTQPLTLIFTQLLCPPPPDLPLLPCTPSGAHL